MENPNLKMKFDFQKWVSIIFEIDKYIYIYIHKYIYIYTNIYTYKHTYIYKFSSFFKTILYKFLHFLKCWSFNFFCCFLFFNLCLFYFSFRFSWWFIFFLVPVGAVLSGDLVLGICCGSPWALCTVTLWRYRRRNSFKYIMMINDCISF